MIPLVGRGKENGKGKQENISFAEERKSEKEQVGKYFVSGGEEEARRNIRKMSPRKKHCCRRVESWTLKAL